MDYEGDPGALDRTLMAMPGVTCVMWQDSAGDYPRRDGHYVVRILSGSPEMFKFMVENQGYCKVIGPA